MKLYKDTFTETRNVLTSFNLPATDYSSVDCELQEFTGGGHYGIELSSMNNLKIMHKALQHAKEYKLKISRFIECRGIVRLPDDEIKAMVNLCDSEGIGLILSVGPRAISDIGGFSHSKNGARMGYRLRGMENIVHAVEDIKRAINLGVTGFLIYDEGLLYLLNKMRASGYLPKNIMIKYSVHAACSNPISAKLIEEQGADTINVIPDLDIFMIKTFREAIDIPMDVFSDTAKAAGGFLRTYDVPDIIRVASPVYLKCGPISQPEQNHLPKSTEIEERVKQAKNVAEHIARYVPEASEVSLTEKTLALPNKQCEISTKQNASISMLLEETHQKIA